MTAPAQQANGGHADLVAFERAVYGRKKISEEARIPENETALKALTDILTRLRDGAHFTDEEQLSTGSITRLASAVIALFFDPGFVLTQTGFNLVAAHRQVLDTVFRASIYNGSDHVFKFVDPAEEHVTKLLLLFSIGSLTKLDLKTTLGQNPQSMIGLYLSLVGYAQVVSPQAHERREALLEMADLFEDIELPDGMFNLLCSAYMHCSYASGENKHDCKRVFHKMLKKRMEGISLPPFGPQIRKERPTIVVLHEWWHSKHAMYRSYAKSIRQLKKDFHLVGMILGKQADQPAVDLFDEWVTFEADPLDMPAIANEIKKRNPDIIYYPSIGMSVWVITMASLRLAPIQVMTYGHPATSNSPEIDYGIIEEDTFNEDRFSERVLTLPSNVVRPTEFQLVSKKHTPRKTDTVKIGITAMQVKVSWPFIHALKMVQAMATKKVEFYFLTAVHGVGLFSLCREIGGQLQNSSIQEKQDYPDYLETMRGMDIALFSFPFGGCNSTIDAMSLGLPMVSMLGREPHSMSDAALIRRAELPEELIAKTEEEYVAQILRLLDDDERGRIAGLVSAVDVQERFFKPDESDAFLNIFRDIYRENTVEMAA